MVEYDNVNEVAVSFEDLSLVSDVKYKINDRKIRFFYHRFVDSLGNIDSIKKSGQDLFLTQDEAVGLCKKISENVSGKRKYRFMI